MIHAESYEIPEETAKHIHSARGDRRRIVAIGTTVVRALEDAALRAAQLGFELAWPGKSGSQLIHLFRIHISSCRFVGDELSIYHDRRCLRWCAPSRVASRPSQRISTP